MNCEEALNFYTSVFPDSKIVSIERYPDRQLDGPPPGMQGKILTAVFELFGQRFMALDGGPHFKPTGAVSFYVECENQEELDSYWSKLSYDPAFEQCGWLTDKYGFFWQIIPSALPKLLRDPDPVKRGHVLDAMLQMKKIDVAKLQEAYESSDGKK